VTATIKPVHGYVTHQPNGFGLAESETNNRISQNSNEIECVDFVDSQSSALSTSSSSSSSSSSSNTPSPFGTHSTMSVQVKLHNGKRQNSPVAGTTGIYQMANSATAGAASAAAAAACSQVPHLSYLKFTRNSISTSNGNGQCSMTISGVDNGTVSNFISPTGSCTTNDLDKSNIQQQQQYQQQHVWRLHNETRELSRKVHEEQLKQRIIYHQQQQQQQQLQFQQQQQQQQYDANFSLVTGLSLNSSIANAGVVKPILTKQRSLIDSNGYEASISSVNHNLNHHYIHQHQHQHNASIQRNS
jgi:hypothetical protein